MPFFDTTGIEPDEQRGPLLNALATLRDQVERLVALNIAWSVQLLPAVIALGFGQNWLRVFQVVPVVYSAIAIVPASGVVFALVARAAQGEHVGLESTRDAVHALALPSIRALAPIYSTLAFVAWGAFQTGEQATLFAVMPRLLLLAGLFCATYIGPLLVEQPQLGPFALFRRSAQLAIDHPVLTLLAWGTALLAMIIGAISVGGLFLIMAVLVALIQTHTYHAIRKR